MSNIEYKIEVMSKYQSGSKIQRKQPHNDAWYDIAHPTWDWDHYEYRIKPKEKVKLHFYYYKNSVGWRISNQPFKNDYDFETQNSFIKYIKIDHLFIEVDDEC